MSVGDTTKEVAQLIIEWVEANPETAEAIEKRINQLKNIADEASKFVGKLSLSMDEQAAVAENLGQVLESDIIESLKGSDEAFDMLLTASQDYDKKQDKLAKAEQKRQAERYQNLQSTVQGFSRMMGWLGFRLTMMGRVISRWVTAPIQATVQGLNNMEKSMLTIGEAMGLGAMFGQDFSDSLGPLLEKFPMISLEMKAVTSTIQAEILAMATEIGPSLISLGWMVAEWLESFGPGFAEGFSEGLDEMTPGLETFLSLLDEHSDTIGGMAARLIPFATALTALGVVMFFVSPALSVLRGFIWLFTSDDMLTAIGAGGTIGAFALALQGLGAGFLVFAAGVTAAKGFESVVKNILGWGDYWEEPGEQPGGIPGPAQSGGLRVDELFGDFFEKLGYFQWSGEGEYEDMTPQDKWLHNIMTTLGDFWEEIFPTDQFKDDKTLRELFEQFKALNELTERIEDLSPDAYAFMIDEATRRFGELNRENVDEWMTFVEAYATAMGTVSFGGLDESIEDLDEAMNQTPEALAELIRKLEAMEEYIGGAGGGDLDQDITLDTTGGIEGILAQLYEAEEILATIAEISPTAFTMALGEAIAQFGEVSEDNIDEWLEFLQGYESALMGVHPDALDYSIGDLSTTLDQTPEGLTYWLDQYKEIMTMFEGLGIETPEWLDDLVNIMETVGEGFDIDIDLDEDLPVLDFSDQYAELEAIFTRVEEMSPDQFVVAVSEASTQFGAITEDSIASWITFMSDFEETLGGLSDIELDTTPFTTQIVEIQELLGMIETVSPDSLTTAMAAALQRFGDVNEENVDEWITFLQGYVQTMSTIYPEAFAAMIADLDTAMNTTPQGLATLVEQFQDLSEYLDTWSPPLQDEDMTHEEREQAWTNLLSMFLEVDNLLDKVEETSPDAFMLAMDLATEQFGEMNEENVADWLAFLQDYESALSELAPAPLEDAIDDLAATINDTPDGMIDMLEKLRVLSEDFLGADQMGFLDILDALIDKLNDTLAAADDILDGTDGGTGGNGGPPPGDEEEEPPAPPPPEPWVPPWIDGTGPTPLATMEGGSTVIIQGDMNVETDGSDVEDLVTNINDQLTDITRGLPKGGPTPR